MSQARTSGLPDDEKEMESAAMDQRDLIKAAAARIDPGAFRSYRRVPLPADLDQRRRAALHTAAEVFVLFEAAKAGVFAPAREAG